MNLAVTAYISYSGPAQGLESFLEDIAEVVVKHGYASNEEHLTSLVSFMESSIGAFEKPVDFAKFVIENSLGWVIPGQEAVNENSSGD